MIGSACRVLANFALVPIFWALDNTVWRRYGNGGSLSAAYRRAWERSW